MASAQLNFAALVARKLVISFRSRTVRSSLLYKDLQDHQRGNRYTNECYCRRPSRGIGCFWMKGLVGRLALALAPHVKINP